MAVRFADAASPQSERTGRVLGFSPTAGPSVGLAAGVAALGLAAAAVTTPEQAAHGPVLCPFRLATGLPCPGCGLTRSWVDLLHGRAGDALAANPFGIVALVVAVALIAVVTSAVVRRQPVPPFAVLLGTGRRRRVLTWLGGALAVAWIGFGLVRLMAAAVG